MSKFTFCSSMDCSHLSFSIGYSTLWSKIIYNSLSTEKEVMIWKEYAFVQKTWTMKSPTWKKLMRSWPTTLLTLNVQNMGITQRLIIVLFKGIFPPRIFTYNLPLKFWKYSDVSPFFERTAESQRARLNFIFSFLMVLPSSSKFLIYRWFSRRFIWWTCP